MTALTEMAHGILLELIAAKSPPKKWVVDAKFGGIKSIPNTNIGQIGEAFAVAALKVIGYADAAKNPQARGEWDITANGKTMEVKCASEDTNGQFQFNHVRYDTKFDFLLAVGIAPNAILFNFYKRETLMQLPLVSMAKKLGGSYKLTRKAADLCAISEFSAKAAEFLGNPSPVANGAGQ